MLLQKRESVLNIQTDNSNVALKLAVRRWVWERIPEHRVLDLYCGKGGKMWEGIWKEADVYLGCDKFRPHDFATTLKISAERAVQSFDLDVYTIFDVDCYASPWAVARRILRRRGPGKFGLILTTGEERALKNGSANEIIRRSIGASELSDLRLLVKYREFVYELMLRSLGELPGITLIGGCKGVAAGAQQMLYFGLVVESEGKAGTSLRAPTKDSGHVKALSVRKGRKQFVRGR